MSQKTMRGCHNVNYVVRKDGKNKMTKLIGLIGILMVFIISAPSYAGLFDAFSGAPSDSVIKELIKKDLANILGLELTSPIKIKQKGSKLEKGNGKGSYGVEACFSFKQVEHYGSINSDYPEQLVKHNEECFTYYFKQEQDNMGKYHWECTPSLGAPTRK